MPQCMALRPCLTLKSSREPYKPLFELSRLARAAGGFRQKAQKQALKRATEGVLKMADSYEYHPGRETARRKEAELEEYGDAQAARARMIRRSAERKNMEERSNSGTDKIPLWSN